MDLLLKHAMGLLMIAIGAWLALRPERETRKIEKRMAEGDDRFFEEQRTYRTYPSLRDPRAIRRIGFVLMFLGAALMVLKSLD